MCRTWHRVSLVIIACLSLSCGGGTSSNPSLLNRHGPGQTTFLNVLIRDTPPTGIAILSFEVTVTGAVLHQGTTNLPILSSPVKVEVTQLETENAYLGTPLPPGPGQYDSVTVTFASPEMTILNNSAAPIAGCAAGSICKLNPPQIGISPASVSFFGPPFPLVLAENTSTALLLDFNLETSVQDNLSIQPTIGVTRLSAVQISDSQTARPELEVTGQVVRIDNIGDFFELKASNGQIFIIRTNSTPSARFEGFEEEGLTNDFSSLKVGQVVEVNSGLTPSGELSASNVELQEGVGGEVLKGTITSIEPDLTKFEMVLLDEIPDIAGVEVGDKVTVDVTNAAYRIDNDGLNIPSDFSFATAADLMVGQTVEVSQALDSSGPSIVAERVRLKTSQLTARVKTITDTNILVNNLSALLTLAGIAEIEVRTSSETGFEDVTGVKALSAGNKLALRGLPFNVTGTPVLVAKKVRKL